MTHYKILQVDPTAEQEVITVAYRRLAAKYHPDVNKSWDAIEKMKDINVAYDVLHDPQKRQAYDEEIATWSSQGGSEQENAGEAFGAGKATKAWAWQFIKQLRLAYYLMLDGRVSIPAKLIPLLALIYVIWPIDLIPDLAPLLGQLDDATVVFIALSIFERLAPPEVVREYMLRIIQDDLQRHEKS